MTLAETRVDQRDFVADLKAHDIDVERQRIEALAIEDQGVLHRRTVRFRPHELKALLEEHMAVADREGLDLADVELVNEGIRGALHRHLGRIGRTEAGSGRQAGQGEGGGAKEFTTGRRLDCGGHKGWAKIYPGAVAPPAQR